MKGSRRATGKSLGRRVGFRTPRRTFLLFCEGRRTEPEYLNALKRDRRVHEMASVDLRIERQNNGNVPLKLVEMAIEARRRMSREVGEVDEFWCIFDVEWPQNHAGLDKAVEIANKNGIKLAISNPCFELWLILHFEKCRSFMDNDSARRRRRLLDGQAAKGVDGDRYMPHLETAVANARVLDAMHADNRVKFPHDNPSSGMHRLITSIISHGSKVILLK